MTEKECQVYIDRVKKLVSQLKAAGDRVKESDVAYTILTGLGERYGSLVTTLTNIISAENPLTVPKVTEAILTEEL